MADEPDDPGAPVELSEDETAVMLGHFAGASFTELATSVGLPVDRLEVIVTRLTSLGLIETQTSVPEADAGAGAGHADEGELDLGDFGDLVPAVPGEGEIPIDDGLVALLDSAMAGLLPGEKAAATAKRQAAAASSATATEAAPEEEAVELSVDEPEAENAAETREYQKLYETELHPLPTEERHALAGTVTGAKLFALCFDPEPAVIGAIFENTAATVEHARLVVFHHRTSHGLNEVMRRSHFLGDPLVHRRLLRNPSLTEAMFRRLMGSKRLLEIHKISIDRDVPERSRVTARALFRTRFTTASPEERVEIVWATEGRILIAMAGLTFDSRTTSILCSRTYASIMLIQSLARFPATPPQLIAHLLRQPLVKRQAHLKNQLLAHSNTPADAKRRT
jgi:hypothetical protein